MGLRKICTEFAIFEEDDPNNDFASLLKENIDQFPQGPGNDDDQSGGPDRDRGNNVRDLITAFTICNNVTPLFKDPSVDKALGDLDYNRVSLIQGDSMIRNSPDRMRATFQPGQSSTVIQVIDSDRLGSGVSPRVAARASIDQFGKKLSKISGKHGKRFGQRLLGCSPDEIQFVEYAEKQGFKLEQRDKDFIQISNCLGFNENYDILADFPFESNNRKQSILV